MYPANITPSTEARQEHGASCQKSRAQGAPPRSVALSQLDVGDESSDLRLRQRFLCKVELLETIP